MATARVQAHRELGVVLEVLAQIDTVVAQRRQAGGGERDRQLAYLWIVVGSRLKNYCQLLGIARGIARATGEFAGAIGVRHKLADERPAKLNVDTLWLTSEQSTATLRAAVVSTMLALAGRELP